MFWNAAAHADSSRRRPRAWAWGSGAIAVVAVLSGCSGDAPTTTAVNGAPAGQDAGQSTSEAAQVPGLATSSPTPTPSASRPRTAATPAVTLRPTRRPAAKPVKPTVLRLKPLRSGRGTTWTTTVRYRGSEEFDTGTVKLWLPDGVKAVRGLMIPGFFPGDVPKDPRPEGDAEALALKYHLGVVTHTYTHREGTRERREAYCEKGSARGLVRALNALSRTSGRAEVASAPFVIYEGYSLAGMCSKGIAQAFPRRTAVLAYGGMSRIDCAIPGVARIPTLIYGGAEDGFVKNIPNEIKACRAKGMPIAVALQPRAGHQIDGSKPTRWAFLNAAIGLRLPATPGGALRQVDLRVGVLANNQTHKIRWYANYRGDRLRASWLPDAQSAYRWREWTTP